MSMHQRPMYQPIEVPDQSDGVQFYLNGNGHFRGIRLASVPHRILALGVDVLLAYLIWKVFDLIIPEAWHTLDGIADLIGFFLAWAFAALNLVWLQSKTGQSIGKMIFGMFVVHPFIDPRNMEHHYFAYPSLWMMTGRTLVHYFADLFFLVGLLFMAKNQRRESIADWCCNTLVLRPRAEELSEVRIERGVTGARDR